MSTDTRHLRLVKDVRPAGSSVKDHYVTFGVQYNMDPHPVIDHGSLANGYVVIEAPDYETARRMAFVLFGQKFSMVYDTWDRPKAVFVPLGELGRYSWTGPGLNTLPTEDTVRFVTN